MSCVGASPLHFKLFMKKKDYVEMDKSDRICIITFTPKLLIG